MQQLLERNCTVTALAHTLSGSVVYWYLLVYNTVSYYYYTW